MYCCNEAATKNNKMKNLELWFKNTQQLTDFVLLNNDLIILNTETVRQSISEKNIIVTFKRK